MTDLKTTFAGLSLRNPIIISSSGLTNSVGKNKKLAETSDCKARILISIASAPASSICLAKSTHSESL